MIRWSCDTLGIMSKMTGKFRFVVHENVETNSEGLAKLISSIDPSGKWLVGVSDFFQWQRTNRSSGSANDGITTSVLKEIRKKIRRLNIKNFFDEGSGGVTDNPATPHAPGNAKSQISCLVCWVRTSSISRGSQNWRSWGSVSLPWVKANLVLMNYYRQ